jgi:hypothetical protein
MNASARRVVTFFALAGLTSAGGAALAQNKSGVPIPPVPKFDKSDAQRYGKAIAYYMDERDRGWRDTYERAKMTLVDARGSRVDREVVFMILEQPEGDKTIVRFQTPADIRGITALIHEHPGGIDDTWLYLPAARRTRRISGANRTASFQGTEFTYEDLARLTVQNYTWRFLADATVGKEPVYKLEAKPSYKDTGYSKLIVYINKNQWRMEKVEFFDRAGRLLKTLSQTRWQNFHGRFWRAATQAVVNHQTSKSTQIEASSLFVNLSLYKRRDGTARNNLTADQFTKRALETNR